MDYANMYIVKINWFNTDIVFKVHTDESVDWLREAIIENQKEYKFDSPCDLMDYICDTYGMEWEDPSADIEVNLEW